MKKNYLPSALEEKLQDRQYRWIVTGVAGFIGSHLLEALLSRNQLVIGIDNFATGKRENIIDVKRIVGEEAFSRFSFIEGSILDSKLCFEICADADFVLHQAALGSVSRSVKDPKRYNDANVAGFLNMLIAARDAKVKKIVYASSSSVYGDEPNLPKREERLGKPLSPYALTKLINEKYAFLFNELYGLSTTGLRYFNVFGPRQDPQGEYAAVIPRWVSERLQGKQCTVFGDGTTSRDFCFVTNVVQANLLAAFSDNSRGPEAFNVALGDETTLRELYDIIDLSVSGAKEVIPPLFADFRVGDIKHSKADISLIKERLGFEPGIKVKEGLGLVVEWYRAHVAEKSQDLML